MVSSPKPPDPDKTAAAQTGMNRDTALTQQGINMVNQVTPDGSLTYSQNGQSSFVDSKGNTVSTPTYTATTTLSPAQQAIKAQTDATSLNLGTLANQQSNKLKDYLNTDFNVNEATEANLYDLGTKRLDPRFANEQEQQRSQLIASGIRPGTPAYDAEMKRFEESKTDAYNQLALTGRNQAFNEALTTRSQPINEISALMSGTQVAAPTFVNTPSSNVAGVDYAGMVQNKYDADLKASQSKMGGLFGLASAGLGLFSDRRLKTAIHRVGQLDNGLPVYSYRYKGFPETYIGLMADEVEGVKPDAVLTHSSGYKMVRYDLATEAA